LFVDDESSSIWYINLEDNNNSRLRSGKTEIGEDPFLAAPPPNGCQYGYESEPIIEEIRPRQIRHWFQYRLIQYRFQNRG
jgi:hypothetical protein